MAKRVAIEYDTSDQASYIPQVENLVKKLGFTPEILSSEQIISGALFGFDAVIFPGGMGAFYGLRTYENFDEAIRYFVANGGGYMGICGGAYVAGLTMSTTLYSYCPGALGLMDVKAVSPPWISYAMQYREAAEERVSVTCKITDEPHPVVYPNQGGVIDIVYSGGPLIRDIGEGVTPLLTYVNGLMPPGDVACCCSVFGKGRVVISSPHPETPWGEELVNTGCQEWLYLNMLRWVTEPEISPFYPFLPWGVKMRGIPYPALPVGAGLMIGSLLGVGMAIVIPKIPKK